MDLDIRGCQALRHSSQLHTAARRYCLERIRHWHTEYYRLQTSGRAGAYTEKGFSHSREALDAFPRYRFLEALLVELESFGPLEFSSLSEARELMTLAVDAAVADYDASKLGIVGVEAIRQEGDMFRAYVAGLDEVALQGVEPLFYRRVLTRTETAKWSKALQHSTYWYPLTDEERSDLIVFDSGAFREQAPVTWLRQAMAARGLSRVLELREHGSCYEVHLQEVDFVYDGIEAYWFTPELDWVVYASLRGL